MFSRPIIVVECPSNLGLKSPREGHEPGVKKLPDWLRQHGLYDILKPKAVHQLVPPDYTGLLDEETGVRNADAIVSFVKDQAHLLGQLALPDEFILAIGGDCSILIGNGLALKKKGRYGLFFLDGHTDYSWPGLSATGGAAGMDFALATGRGPEKLTGIDNKKPYFRPQDCLNAGNRYYNPAYTTPMETSGISYLSLAGLRKEGMKTVADRFLAYVNRERLDGFWIHVDVDVLNNDLMPAVDSPQPDGLSYEEWEEILTPLLGHPLAAGMEITILDPELDADGVYTEPFVSRLAAIFNSI